MAGDELDAAARLERLAQRGRARPAPTTASRSTAPAAPVEVPLPDDVAARLAQLADRRPATSTAPAPPPAEPAGPRSASSPSKGPRRHAAPAARALAAGLSSTAFFSGVAVLAAAPEPAWESQPPDTTPAPTTTPPTTAPPPPPTIVVVQRLHRVVYVDAQGNPVSGSAPAPPPRATASPPRQSATPAPAPAAAPAPAPAPAPTPPPPTVPRCSGSQC